MIKKYGLTIGILLVFALAVLSANLPEDWFPGLLPQQGVSFLAQQTVSGGIPYGIPATQAIYVAVWVTLFTVILVKWARKSVPHRQDKTARFNTEDGFEIMVRLRIRVEPFPTAWGLLRSKDIADAAVDAIYEQAVAFMSEKIEAAVQVLGGHDRAKLNAICKEFMVSGLADIDQTHFGARTLSVAVVDSDYDMAAEQAKRSVASGKAANRFTRTALGLPEVTADQPLSWLQGLAGAALQYAGRDQGEEIPIAPEGGDQ